VTIVTGIVLQDVRDWATRKPKDTMVNIEI
jgi:hypothetical protein